MYLLFNSSLRTDSCARGQMSGPIYWIVPPLTPQSWVTASIKSTSLHLSTKFFDPSLATQKYSWVIIVTMLNLPFTFFFFSPFLGPPPQHMEVPRLGVSSEPACTRGRHHSPQQRWILNPLIKATDRTWNLTVPSWIHFRCATTRNSPFIFLFIPTNSNLCTHGNLTSPIQHMSGFKSQIKQFSLWNLSSYRRFVLIQVLVALGSRDNIQSF